MKAKLIILIVGLFSVFLTIGQEKVEIQVSEKEMSAGIQTAFTVNVPEASVKVVENEWKKFINERSFFEFAGRGTSQTFEKAFIGISNIFSPEKKTFSKNSLNVKRINNEFVVKDVIHEEVTHNHIDVFVLIFSDENNVYLSSYFQYSDSLFINETNISIEAFGSIKNYIRQFGVEAYRNVVKEEEKDLKKINKEIKGDKKRIKNQKEKIKSKKSDILINEKEQQMQLEVIRIQETRAKEFEEKLASIT